MAETEHAWLLDGRQLLFLLSLADSRPVPAFPLPDPAGISADEWKQVVMELHRGGLLAFGDKGVEMTPDLAALIAGIKEADTLWVACSRDGEAHVQALYTGASGRVLLQAGKSGYRLSRWEDSLQSWLDTRLGLPARVRQEAPDRPPEELAPDLPPVRPAVSGPAPRWGAWEAARTIVDVWRGGAFAARLVFWQGSAGCALLCQTAEGDTLLPDSLTNRQKLWKRLAGGKP